MSSFLRGFKVCCRRFGDYGTCQPEQFVPAATIIEEAMRQIEAAYGWKVLRYGRTIVARCPDCAARAAEHLNRIKEKLEVAHS